MITSRISLRTMTCVLGVSFVLLPALVQAQVPVGETQRDLQRKVSLESYSDWSFEKEYQLRPMNENHLGSSTRPVKMSLKGKVWFEERYTRVSEGFGADGPEQRSEKYWSLVVEGQNKKAVLNHMFAPGSAQPPEYVEVAGVVLRPGSIVQLEGWAVQATAEQSVLLGVEWVTLLMD